MFRLTRNGNKMIKRYTIIKSDSSKVKESWWLTYNLLNHPSTLFLQNPNTLSKIYCIYSSGGAAWWLRGNFWKILIFFWKYLNNVPLYHINDEITIYKIKKYIVIHSSWWINLLTIITIWDSHKIPLTIYQIHNYAFYILYIMDVYNNCN